MSAIYLHLQALLPLVDYVDGYWRSRRSRQLPPSPFPLAANTAMHQPMHALHALHARSPPCCYFCLLCLQMTPSRPVLLAAVLAILAVALASGASIPGDSECMCWRAVQKAKQAIRLHALLVSPAPDRWIRACSAARAIRFSSVPAHLNTGCTCT